MTQPADNFVRVPACACPVCGYTLDTVGAVDEGPPVAPRPGDHTVCIECLSFLRFIEGSQLQVLSEAQVGELANATRQALVRTRRLLQRIKGR